MGLVIDKKVRHVGVGALKISDRAKRYVNQALNADRLSIGRFVHTFEKKFARLHGRPFGVMLNSGTSALHIALGALKEKYSWQDGDEVIVPAITFIASSNVVLYNNLRPVFCDVDLPTYNISPEAIRQKIGPRTRAIMPVHLYGLPCEMDEIREIAREHNLSIIEDSCETMFARYKGRPVGSFGEAACFSTYVAHILVTGVGGLVITEDIELAAMCRSLLAHGRDPRYLDIDQDDDITGDSLDEVIEKRFSFVRLGHSFRPTELEAAIGLAELENYQENIRKRRENAAALTRKLGIYSDKLQLPIVPDDRQHSFMMYPITVCEEGMRNDLVRYLERNGIETRFSFPLIHQPVYKKLFGLNINDFPAAKFIGENSFYIGCHQWLTEEDIEYVADVFESFFLEKYRSW
jgi:CDP-6-deoxy-D-xylo-4-hexulose-3-dehydrase